MTIQPTKTKARGQGGLSEDSNMNHLGRKALKALRRQATALWREKQPPFSALQQMGGCGHVCAIAIAPSHDIGLYACGIPGEPRPLQYGFVFPDPETSQPCYLPIETFGPPATHSETPPATSPASQVEDPRIAEGELSKIRALLDQSAQNQQAAA